MAGFLLSGGWLLAGGLSLYTRRRSDTFGDADATLWRRARLRLAAGAALVIVPLGVVVAAGVSKPPRFAGEEITERSAVEQLLGTRRSELARCVDAARDKPVRIFWVIDDQGLVVAPSVRDAASLDEVLCLASAMKGWRFDAHRERRAVSYDL